jgi:hypothetical protein
MDDVAARFLASQPKELLRESMDARFPGEYSWAARGSAWRALANEVGIPCPDALVVLGDAMAERLLYFAFGSPRRHQYEMLTPEDARDRRALLARLAHDFGELTPYTQMLPVFGQDGDLLLLDPSGAVHVWFHDDWSGSGRVASSLDDLLAHAMAPTLNM